MPVTSVHVCFPTTHLSRQTHVCKWELSCLEASSEQACKTDALAGSSDQACLSPASWSLVWGAAIRSHAEIIRKTECDNPHFASGGQALHEQCSTGEGKEAISSSYYTS
jgi:hypothetical protein